jgi:copper(I)-binding protein
MRIRLAPAAALFAAVALAAACSSGSGSPSTGALTIGGAWARPAAMGQTGAAYLVISAPAGAADALLSASSPDAASVEIHRSSMSSDGMMGMSPVDRVEIPAGGSVTFAPGGYHLMLMGLTRPLDVGGKLELHLVFEKAGSVVVQAEVRQG